MRNSADIMTQTQTISIRSYAKKLGITDKSVRNAITGKKIKNGVIYNTAIRGGVMVYIPAIIEDIADQEFGHVYKNRKALAGNTPIYLSELTKMQKTEKNNAEFNGSGTA